MRNSQKQILWGLGKIGGVIRNSWKYGSVREALWIDISSVIFYWVRSLECFNDFKLQRMFGINYQLLPIYSSQKVGVKHFEIDFEIFSKLFQLLRQNSNN